MFATLQLSDELAEIVGTHTTTKPEVITMVWSYIKKNKLQDPKKTQYVTCDEKMMKVFGVKKFR